MGRFVTRTMYNNSYRDLIYDVNIECARLDDKVVDVQYIYCDDTALPRWIAFIKCKIE